MKRTLALLPLPILFGIEWTAVDNGRLLAVVIVLLVAVLVFVVRGTQTKGERDAERRATFLLAAASEARVITWEIDARGLILDSVVTEHAAGGYKTGLLAGQNALTVARAAGSMTTVNAIETVLRDRTQVEYVADWTSPEGERVVADVMLVPTSTGGARAFSVVVTGHVVRAEMAETELIGLRARLARLDAAAGHKAAAEADLDRARGFLSAPLIPS